MSNNLNPKYNTMCDVGFTVLHNHEDPNDITLEEYLVALKRRVAELESHTHVSASLEAFGILDTYEIGALNKAS